MEASSQEEAKKWEGSLRNNLGYAYHLAGRYDEALAQFRLSLAAHERSGRAANVRIAHWMIARTLRFQGKVQEAIAIQLRLEREWNEAGQPDPYVFEELEKLYRDAGNAALADAYAAKLRGVPARSVTRPRFARVETEEELPWPAVEPARNRPWRCRRPSSPWRCPRSSPTG